MSRKLRGAIREEGAEPAVSSDKSGGRESQTKASGKRGGRGTSRLNSKSLQYHLDYFIGKLVTSPMCALENRYAELEAINTSYDFSLQ